MQREQLDLLSQAASTMASDMAAKCRDAAADARVALPVGDFRNIAALLQQLAAAMQEGRSGLDADGFRFWMPLAEAVAQRRELAQLRARTGSPAAARALDRFDF